MLHGKVYIGTSPELVSTVNRNFKTLAFNHFIAQLGRRITGHDEAMSRIVQRNLKDEQRPGYVIDIHDLKAARSEVDLFAWTHRMVTLCSTSAIYGSRNPFSLTASTATCSGTLTVA